MNNIITDMSLLTSIPEKTLTKFFKKVCTCICESVAESALDPDKNIVQMNIGIGVLSIKIDPECPKYHFEPNDFLAKSVKQTIQNKENILIDLLNDSLSKNFKTPYKDILE